MPLNNAPLHIEEVSSRSLGDLSTLFGEGMANTPILIAAMGNDPSRRRTSTNPIMQELVTSKNARVDVVRQNGVLVAAAASSSSRSCQPHPTTTIRLLTMTRALGPRAAVRSAVWLRAWAERDLQEPHVHLGPVCVVPTKRGEGIGSLLLLRHTSRLDTLGATGYLETDEPRNVEFFTRFGYQVIHEQRVLGVPCWFMRRPAT